VTGKPATERLGRRILALEFAGFQFVLLVIWLDEFFDLESRVRGLPLQPINWFHFLLETGSVVVLMMVVMASTFWLFREIRRLESFVMVCSWCKKVRHDGQWISFEQFLEMHHESATSHGMCPECFTKETSKQDGK
jgi:hypothetical protein